jgi:hypothetical protein
MDYLCLIDLYSYISRSEEISSKDNSLFCTLSNKNILALSNDNSVYILPIEKPNELIPVTISNSIFLVWSDDGQFLLNVNKNGVCNLFSIKVYTNASIFMLIIPN